MNWHTATPFTHLQTHIHTRTSKKPHTNTNTHTQTDITTQTGGDRGNTVHEPAQYTHPTHTPNTHNISNRRTDVKPKQTDEDRLTTEKNCHRETGRIFIHTHSFTVRQNEIKRRRKIYTQ